MIGEEAERLCWIFCMVDRNTVDKTVFNWSINGTASAGTFSFRARPELGRFAIHLNKREWVDFIELTLAEWLEQVEGAAEKSFVGKRERLTRIGERRMRKWLKY